MRILFIQRNTYLNQLIIMFEMQTVSLNAFVYTGSDGPTDFFCISRLRSGQTY